MTPSPLIGLTAFLPGFLLGGSLIVAIGAQNAFVLRQGIRRDHVFAVALTCVVCDWALISLGALGFGRVVSAFPAVTVAASWLGAAFLLGYGAMSFRSALRPGIIDADGGANVRFTGTAAAVGATLAISLLNPHVYLDTVVLIGGVAARYQATGRLLFAFGAAAASTVWFFGIGFGARALAPLFAKPSSWRVLDVIVGVVMWSIAASLVAGVL